MVGCVLHAEITKGFYAKMSKYKILELFLNISICTQNTVAKSYEIKTFLKKWEHKT